MKFCPTCNTNFEDTLSFCPRDGDVLQESPENLVGKVLDGKYEIEKFLAQGGMGAVYLARHILLGDRVVIKVLRSEMRQNAEWLRRFQREGRAARSFRHPNAVTVYDMSAGGDGLIYMVMEYVEGLTLDKELKERKRFSPREALEVLEPVADALDAAHSRGVVHRDMKPENVMLGVDHEGERVVKLLDLGIAKMIGVADAVAGEPTSLTVAGQILGTPYYMSPEQWGEPPRDGNHEVDGRTDVYSLGVIFFELVAGRKPHAGSTLSELRNEHVRGSMPDLRALFPDIPQSFASAVAHAMAKDRADRPQTAGQLISEVRESLGVLAETRIQESANTGLPRSQSSGSVDTAHQGQSGTAEISEPSRADTILTSEFAIDSPASSDKVTSAQPARPVTNANVDRGGLAHPTAAGAGSNEAETAFAGGFSHVAAPVHATSRKRPWTALVLGGGLALLFLVGAGGWLAWKTIGAPPSEPPPGERPEPPPPPKRIEAMSYWIEAFDAPNQGDIQRIAETTAPLVSGQHFKFHFSARNRGYLYIVGPGKEGNALMTFLTAQGGGLLKTNLVAGGADYEFPFGEDKVLILDENAGTEEYTVIFSPMPLLSPSFLAEKYLKELSPAEVKEFEDFRAANRTAQTALDVNHTDGQKRVVVSVPEDTAERPVIFDIRIKHE
jgi:eukaryotic-like serine/threonine-protein kinase